MDDAGSDDAHRQERLTALCTSLEEFCVSDALSLDGLRKRLAAIPPSFLEQSFLLCYVCKNERVTMEIAKCILDAIPGAPDAPVRNPRGSTNYPLHVACANEKCSDDIIELLVEKSESAILHHLCAVPPHGVPSGEYDHSCVEGTPIHYYLARGSNIDIGTVKMLVEACPESLNTADEESGFTPLHVYLCNPCSDLAIVRFLIDKEPYSAQWPCGYDEVPLHFACANSNANAALVGFLLGSFPEAIHHANVSGHLPIHILCQNRELNDSASLEIYAMLAEREPGLLRETDADGELPIHLAAAHKSLEFCKVLLEAYPESVGIETDAGALPFHQACRGGYLDTVKYLLELRPGDLFATTEGGYFPIHFAAGCWYPERRAEIVRYLLQKDPEGATRTTTETQSLPLHLACRYTSECLESVKVLFDSHPWAIVAEDSDGKTPVDLARTRASRDRDHLPVVRFLEYQLEHCQKSQDRTAMTSVDENGRLPLHNALWYVHTLGTIKLLVKGNPSALQVADRETALPLHIACAFSTADIVRYLLEFDSSHLEARDQIGDTILHCACRRGNLGVATYLLERNVPLVSERNYANKLPIHLLCEADEDEVDRQSPEYVETIWRLLLAHPETVLE